METIIQSRFNIWLQRPLTRIDALSYVIPYLILAYSVWAVASWFTNWMGVVSISPDWVTMKPVTALCFLVTSTVMTYQIHRKPMTRNYFAGWLSSLCMCIVAAFAFNVEALNVFPGFEDADAVYTLLPDFPSWATIFLFTLFSVSHFFKSNLGPGLTIFLFGSCALMGYAFEIPSMWFYFDGFSTGMAFTTSIFFWLIGVWMTPWKRILVKLK